jgi:hypothetical protein
MDLQDIVDLEQYPISDEMFRAAAKAAFDASGVFVMEGFVRPDAVEAMRAEGEAGRDRVYTKPETHTVYLSKPDPEFAPDHPRNRLVTSSKGCLTDDQIGADSPLRALYDDPAFREFLCHVLGERQLFEYADPLSSINLHFHETGQELGWHFDNSSFSITLMVQAPEKGGQFEYVTDIRDADAGDMGFETVASVLDGDAQVDVLDAAAGTLVFFRGRNSMHRVAPNEGARTRMLAVLAYNSKPGVALSETARMTFYGRTG